MSEGTLPTRRAEWRRWGYLPVVAAIGYTTLGIQTFAIGPFVAPLEAEFGWSRAQTMSGLTLSNILGVFFNLAIGMLVDRFGPRRVGLAGQVVKCAAFALLATASGTLLNWSLLWVLVALGAMLTQSTIWTSAVAGRFDKGRGLALAMALSGTSICAAIAPVLGTWLIGLYGWRTAMPALSGLWLLAVFPIVFLFFRGPQEARLAAGSASEAAKSVSDLPGHSLAEARRMMPFHVLLYAGFAYSLYVVALSANLIPLLTDKGASAMGAAQIASMMGLMAIVSRISAGFLLDFLTPHLLGAAVFLLPVAGCLMLLLGEPSPLLQLLAVLSFGMTIGAEFDVIIYLTSRHFGIKAFGAIFGAMITAGALGGAIGPVLAGWIHDHYGSYDPLLWLLTGLMLAGSALIGLFGKPGQDFGGAH